VVNLTRSNPAVSRAATSRTTPAATRGNRANRAAGRSRRSPMPATAAKAR
jgi:hypothetical protein